MSKPLDITGRRIGCLTAVHYLFTNKDGARVWLIRCDCGNERKTQAAVFVRGTTKSCGCKTSELVSQAQKGHPKPWLRKNKLQDRQVYGVWLAMHKRCRLSTNPSWKNYGGRGIAVCPEWATLDGFWQNMGATYQSGLTLERRDNNAGYSVANCYWATRKQQQRNMRTNRFIETPWGRLTIAETAERMGIRYGALHHRLERKGLTLEIFHPLMR